MKKNQSKFMALVLAIVLAFSAVSLIGCGATESGPDTSKTVLRVSVYDAGFGKTYMEDAEKEFEALFADVSFEDGKTGIDVFLDPNKYIGTDLVSNIAYSKNDLFFTEQLYYKEFVTQGLIANLDDVLSDTGSEFGESETVSSKMSSVIKDAYTHSDNSVYALPTYLTTVGINYNIDLFDNYCLYFSSNKNNGNDGFVNDLTETKSNGPDGESGTYDDGLPATYEDFYKLCEKMLDYQITPITWGDLTYVNGLLTELQSDYEGVDNMNINFTFSGDATNIVKSINPDGSPVVESKTITNENGYEVYKQAGRYYALSFIETLIKKGYVNTASLSSSTAYSYTTAQQDFIMSGVAGKKEIGMLVEGDWWENEATGIFNELVSVMGNRYAKGNMHFGYMPLPKATSAQIGKGNCSTALLSSGVILNAKTQGPTLEVAKLFLRYMFTDKQMNNFVKRTGVPYVYDYEKDGVAGTAYGDSLSKYIEKTSIVYPFSNNVIYIKNASKFNVWFHYWDTLVKGSPYGNITPIIDGNVTATQYFNGLYTQRQADWSSLSK